MPARVLLSAPSASSPRTPSADLGESPESTLRSTSSGVHLPKQTLPPSTDVRLLSLHSSLQCSSSSHERLSTTCAGADNTPRISPKGVNSIANKQLQSTNFSEQHSILAHHSASQSAVRAFVSIRCSRTHRVVMTKTQSHWRANEQSHVSLWKRGRWACQCQHIRPSHQTRTTTQNPSRTSLPRASLPSTSPSSVPTRHTNYLNVSAVRISRRNVTESRQAASSANPQT